MTVTIMRGIPGSGKSTYLEEHWLDKLPPFRSHVLVSADHYFEGPEGYKFDPSKLGEAHETCMRNFVRSVYLGTTYIAVDNTNISVAEIAPYYSVARAFGYNVEIVNCFTPTDIASQRNVHGVPASACERMANALAEQKLPPFWTYKNIIRG